MGLSKLQWTATKADIPEHMQSKFVAFPLKKLYDIYMFGRNFHTEKMVPRVSRSVHARFTVIVGLLPVIVGLLPVIVGPVHARFTLGSR